MACTRCKAGHHIPCDFACDRVLIADPAGQIVLDVPQGKTADAPVGRPLEHLAHPGDRAPLRHAFRQATAIDSPVLCLFREATTRIAWLGRIEVPCRKGSNVPSLVACVLRPVCELLFHLSSRQREILRSLVSNPNVAHVSRQLKVSPSTVRAHLVRAQTAIRVSNLDELLVWATTMRHALDAEPEVEAFISRQQG